MSELSDPRVLFAAERTLLAWNRTSISFMAFGFVVERFGLFITMLGRTEMKVFQRELSFHIGILFIALSVIVSFLSIVQHRHVLQTLRPVEIPKGYNVRLPALVNAIVGLLGLVLIYYIFQGF
jgi:putative membrane protein